MRTQRTFTQTLVPVLPEKLYKCELVANISCGIPGFEGAQARVPGGARGDILELKQETFIHFVSHGWAKPLRGQDLPGEDLASFGEVDLTKPPAQPQKLPAKLRVKLLRGNVSLGNGIQNAVVGEKYLLPSGDALYLAGQNVVEIVDDLPKPDVEIRVIRAEPHHEPAASGALESLAAQIDRRLRK